MDALVPLFTAAAVGAMSAVFVSAGLIKLFTSAGHGHLTRLVVGDYGPGMRCSRRRPDVARAGASIVGVPALILEVAWTLDTVDTA